MEKLAEPKKEDIDELHELYLKNLQELFDEHKVEYSDYPDACLEFV